LPENCSAIANVNVGNRVTIARPCGNCRLTKIYDGLISSVDGRVQLLQSAPNRTVVGLVTSSFRSQVLIFCRALIRSSVLQAASRTTGLRRTMSGTPANWLSEQFDPKPNRFRQRSIRCRRQSKHRRPKSTLALLLRACRTLVSRAQGRGYKLSVKNTASIRDERQQVGVDLFLSGRAPGTHDQL